MRMTTTMLAAFALLAAACGGEIEREGTREGTTEHADRFVGDWDVSFNTNRDSTGSFTLTTAGDLVILRRGQGTPLEAIAERSGSKVTCAVGSRWHSAGASVLVFESASCSDGTARDVAVSFPADASMNASYELRVEVSSVGGETGWRATDFNGPWVLHRCTRAGCG